MDDEMVMHEIIVIKFLLVNKKMHTQHLKQSI